MTLRPVLMPGGWPPNERERDACARVLVACQGDFARIIDAPALDEQAYAQHVARIAFFQQPDVSPLFFIQGAAVTADHVMQLRSRVVDLAPVLDRASWVICLDPTRLFDFIAQAAEWAPVEEVVTEGLFAWRMRPSPMLIVGWSANSVDIATALTSVETAPESGFIATVAGSHARAAFNAEGAVVGLESLARMRAVSQAPPAQEPGERSTDSARSGERGSGLVRPNPRLRRNSG